MTSVGAVHADVYVMNTGPLPCELPMLRHVSVLRSSGTPLPLRTPPSGPGTVHALELAAHQSAWLVLSWTDWCGGHLGRLSTKLTFDGATVVTSPFDGPPDFNATPYCLDANRQSAIQILATHDSPN